MSATELTSPVDLDSNIDDFEDLPGFLSPPTGSYAFTIKGTPEVKETDDGKKLLSIMFEILSFDEIDTGNLDTGEDLPKQGDVFAQSFDTANLYGVNAMKQIVKPFKEALGTATWNETFAGMAGMTCVGIIKRRYNKEKDRNYSKFVKLVVA